MYLLMNENKAIFEFKFADSTNEAICINQLADDSDLPFRGVNDFFRLRENNKKFIKKCKDVEGGIKCLSRYVMCERRAISFLNHWSNCSDKLWIKEAESIMTFGTASKRLINCEIQDWSYYNIMNYEMGIKIAPYLGEFDNALAIRCSKRMTKAQFEHLLKLEDTFLIFSLDKDYSCFKKKDFLNLSGRLKSRSTILAYTNNFRGYCFKKAIAEEDLTKPIQFFLKDSDREVCLFNIDKVTKHVDIKDIYDYDSYKKFKYKFGSIANFYTSVINSRSNDVENNIMTTSLINDETKYWCVNKGE